MRQGIACFNRANERNTPSEAPQERRNVHILFGDGADLSGMQKIFAAIRKFRRVLKHDGWAILLVPIIADKTFTRRGQACITA